MSQAEENYIKAIFHIQSEVNSEVSTKAISEELETSPASVSDMLKKLASKKLINYVKYKGVTLTDQGKALATKTIRKHRLWEVFLVQKLHFNWDQVHEVAEELEHIQSPLLIQRLDEFLDFPKYDPHGDPIPDQNGMIQKNKKVLLSDFKVDEKSTVIGVKDTDAKFLQYLDKLGIHLGCEIKVIDFVEYDGSIEIQINSKQQQLISKEVANNIYLKRDEKN